MPAIRVAPSHLALLLVLAATAPRPASAALVLNEIMASNATTVPDEHGDFDDWIEVLNTGPGSVDLTGMFLTDDLALTTRWSIPSLVLDPGERVLFWADAEPGEGAFHTTFRLEAAGEAVGLFDTIANGNAAIDTTSFGEQATDASFGRFPDGTGAWIYMATPTPNGANVDEGNIPPLVSDTQRAPSSPLPNEAVTVTARMRDLDGTLTDTRLFYNSGPGFLATTLFDDGMHGDGAAGDQIHGAQVPGFPANTTVRYYVRARDDSLAQTLDPAGAPGITYSYVVGFNPPPLFINEFLAINDTTNADEFGEFDDWVEIYNAGPGDVDLAGLHLSDTFANPTRYTFPAVNLPAGGFLIVWCDGQPAQGALHADFALSGTGEEIGLFSTTTNGNAVIDSVTYGPQTADVSLGREPDGGPMWRSYTSPTPGASNVTPDGVFEEPSPGGGEVSALALRLDPPRPQPVRHGGAVVGFALPRPGVVRLVVYDVSGRPVRLLVDGRLDAGPHRVALDSALRFRGGGGGGAGGDLPSGVYFLRLDALGESRVAKLHVLR